MNVAEQVITENYALYNSDCIPLLQGLPDASIHLSLYSPPFATLNGGAVYHYSSSERDLSNCDTYADFWQHYGYVVRELCRATLPGRMTAVHCTDISSGNSGHDHLNDFPGDIIRAHEVVGWRYVARYCVWKEPLGVRNRTYAKSLMHKTVVDDSSLCSNAVADYLLVFRKRGDNPEPIAHPQGFASYAGSRPIPADVLKYRNWPGNQIENKFSHWIWRQYASAFWDDVRFERVLPFREAREDGDEKHVHPLQLDIIERVISLWSNPGDTVIDPFGGVGSTPHTAVQLGRRGIGVELKPSYFRQMVRNMEYVDDPVGEQRDLFSLAAETEVAD